VYLPEDKHGDVFSDPPEGFMPIYTARPSGLTQGKQEGHDALCMPGDNQPVAHVNYSVDQPPRSGRLKLCGRGSINSMIVTRPRHARSPFDPSPELA
jgi:hypothetical protein